MIIFHIFADNDFGDIIRNRLVSLDVNGNLTRTDYKTTPDAQLLVSQRRKQKTFISQLLVLRALKKAVSLLVKVKSSGELNGTNNQSGMPSKQSKENVVHCLFEKLDGRSVKRNAQFGKCERCQFVGPNSAIGNRYNKR